VSSSSTVRRVKPRYLEVSSLRRSVISNHCMRRNLIAFEQGRHLSLELSWKGLRTLKNLWFYASCKPYIWKSAAVARTITLRRLNPSQWLLKAFPSLIYWNDATAFKTTVGHFPLDMFHPDVSSLPILLHENRSSAR